MRPLTAVSASARLALGVAFFIVFIAGWSLATFGGFVSKTFLADPVSMVRSGWQLLATQGFGWDIGWTVWRVFGGFVIAAVLALPLGVAMGAYKPVEAFFEPFVSFARYLPASAFIPLLIIWLGLGEPSKIAMLFIGTVFFNTLMTADVVRHVPRSIIDVSYTLGARRGEVLHKVIVPHSMPGIIDAIRVNAAAAWNFVVVAELVNATAGLGYRIVRAQRFLQTDKIFAVLIVIGLAGVTIDIALRLLRSRVGRWAG
jgi:NitT/TauT family transport system permease protein